MEENINSESNKGEKFIHSEEEILTRAAIFAEEGKIEIKDSDSAKEIIEEIKEMPVYKEYKNRDFTLEGLQDKLSLINNQEQRDVILPFLQQTIDDVKEKNHRYNKLVRGFEKSMKIENFRLAAEEKKAKIEKYDQNRRNCHDSLMADFNILRRNFMKIFPKEENLVFSEEQVNNRDYVGTWARVTATGEELEQYLNKLSLIKK